MDQKDFRAEFEKQLKKTNFPQDHVIENVIAYSFAMFNAKSLQELGMNVTDYRETIHAISEEKLSLYQMSHILNNLPGMSARDLGLTINEYTNLMVQVETMAFTWNEVMKPIQDKLVDEVNREAAKAVRKNSKNVNPNLRKS